MSGKEATDEAAILREQAIRRRQRIIDSGASRLKSVGVEDKDAQRIIEGRRGGAHTNAHTFADDEEEAAANTLLKEKRKCHRAIVDMLALLTLEILAVWQAWMDFHRKRVECDFIEGDMRVGSSFRLSGVNAFLIWAQLSAFAVRVLVGREKGDGSGEDSIFAMISSFIALPKWLTAGIRSVLYLKRGVGIFKDFCLFYLTYQIAHAIFHLISG